MNISSTSLFRFVTEFEHLKAILTDGFVFRPLIEKVEIGSYPNDPFAGTDIVQDELHSLAICFCDLPLSQSSNHRAQYGNYAIAMSKEWAMRNGITPIRYYHSKSPDHADSMKRKLLDILEYSETNPHGPLGVLARLMRENGDSPPDLDELYQSSAPVKMLLEEANRLLSDSLSHCEKTFHFTRVYEGDWADRTTNNLTSRKFYDEREWRAVAFDSSNPLKFQLADIRHILVTTKVERKEIWDLVNQHAESLGVSDPIEICSIAKVGDEIFGDL